MKPYQEYSPPFLYRNGHINTICSNIFRKVNFQYTDKFIIDTPDEDFLEINTVHANSDKAVVLYHGLEGSTNKTYMKGMAKLLHENGYDIFAVNFRGCGEKSNQLFSSYHSGKTDDLETVISFINSKFPYKSVSLIGFSLGGNVLLKYLGEKGQDIDKVNAAVAISVPCDLKAAAFHLKRKSNVIYIHRLIKSLKTKLALKIAQFPTEGLTLNQVKVIKDFQHIDDLYTAPYHGFKDAEEYWQLCSSKRFLDKIKVNTLIINALDDPFLPPACFPYEEVKNSSYLSMLTPKFGGHVGFANCLRLARPAWHEETALQFIAEQL